MVIQKCIQYIVCYILFSTDFQNRYLFQIYLFIAVGSSDEKIWRQFGFIVLVKHTKLLCIMLIHNSL